jgi:hypothetical protein
VVVISDLELADMQVGRGSTGSLEGG